MKYILLLFIIITSLAFNFRCNHDNNNDDFLIKHQIDSIISHTADNDVQNFKFKNDQISQHLIFVSLSSNNYINEKACFKFIQTNKEGLDIDTVYGYLSCSLSSEVEIEMADGEIADIYLCYNIVEEQYFYIEFTRLKDSLIIAKFYIYNNKIGEIDENYPKNVLTLIK